MSAVAEITTWEASGLRGLKIDGVAVKVERPLGDFAEERAQEIAERIARMPLLEKRLADLEKRVPPRDPVRTLGSGAVRFRDGRPWLLNSAAEGWAAWGVRCDSWDDLFRRYAVVVTAHGLDADGPFWRVDPAPGGGTL